MDQPVLPRYQRLRRHHDGRSPTWRQEISFRMQGSTVTWESPLLVPPHAGAARSLERPCPEGPSEAAGCPPARVPDENTPFLGSLSECESSVDRGNVLRRSCGGPLGSQRAPQRAPAHSVRHAMVSQGKEDSERRASRCREKTPPCRVLQGFEPADAGGVPPLVSALA